MMEEICDDKFYEHLDTMWNMNAQSALAAASIAAKHMTDGGMLVLTGAAGNTIHFQIQ